MADIVERLRMLHALTTPGEWKEDAYQDHWGHGRLLLGHSGKGTYVCHVVTDISAKTRATTTKYQGVRFANLAFIAAAHNELPALLSEHDRQREEIVRLVEALTPSRDTKAAYIGEFSHRVTSISDEGEEQSFEAAVPWPTIKEIMAAILARSALSDTTVVEGRPECICPTCGIRHGGTVTDDIQF